MRDVHDVRLCVRQKSVCAPLPPRLMWTGELWWKEKADVEAGPPIRLKFDEREELAADADVFST